MSKLIEATYSVEDNKLRLYPGERLDADTYARVKAAGFKWAPKQSLFVAPAWTPEREDLCVDLAGDVEAEQTTLAERAAAKAERLDSIAGNRDRDAINHFRRADELSERFSGGQPILIGHHSERRARRDQEKLHSAMSCGVDAQRTAAFFRHRATAVERHVNTLNHDRTRARRVGRLKAELRRVQRTITEAYLCRSEWMDIREVLLQIEDPAMASEAFSRHLQRQTFNSYPEHTLLASYEAGAVTLATLLDTMVDRFDSAYNSSRQQRWIIHLVNRIAYEQSCLPAVERFAGVLTDTVLKAFARDFGAHKPSAKHLDNGTWSLCSIAPLPQIIGDGHSEALTEAAWLDRFVELGYAVPAKRPRRQAPSLPPLINPSRKEAERLQTQWNAARQGSEPVGDEEPLPVVSMTQAEFTRQKGHYSSRVDIVEVCRNGQVRRPYISGHSNPERGVVRVRVYQAPALFADYQVVQLSDKPARTLPMFSHETAEGEA